MEADPETTSVRILDNLRSLKYKTDTLQGGAAGLRKGIVKGDKKVIQQLLLWLLKNPDDIKRRAYLAKYVNMTFNYK